MVIGHLKTIDSLENRQKFKISTSSAVNPRMIYCSCRRLLLRLFMVSGLILWLFVSVTGYVLGDDSLPADMGVDLRVMIDVSGSMKQSDPKNLRAPALRLLAGLLPEGSRSGVWTFGQHINMPVPLGKVDKRWKKEAEKEAGKIHSRELFTDIEQVLLQATADLNQPDPHFRRSIILLSDGKVDISKDAEKNEQSRQRIIQSVLPKLRSAGVVVHTIALSDNADHELLKTLAVSTDGWYENAKSADNLHRIFLRLFEKSAPSDTLPLRNNVFKVDSSIKDMTLLIFHQPNDKNVGVIDAKGKKYTEAAHPDNVQWHSEDQFDLVTITNPQAGQWSLDTKEDPDNRVMVVTNLKLGLNELPNNIMIGENLAVHAQLLQENKLLTEKTIMDRVGFSLQQQQGGDKEEKISLLDNGKEADKAAGDYIFSASLEKLAKEGEVALDIAAVGPTFQREIHRSIRINKLPVVVKVEQLPPEQQSKYRITLTPRPEIEQLEIQSIAVQISSKPEAISVPKQDKIWQLDLPAEMAGQTVVVSTTGVHNGSRKFALQWQETLPGSAVNKPESNHQAHQDSKITDGEKKEEKVRWPLVIALIMMVNGILGLAGLGGYMVWRKRRAVVEKQQESEVAYE